MNPRPTSPSLADTLLASKNLVGKKLQQFEESIDWESLQTILKPLIHAEGRPPFPPLAMFKALLLGRWYNLSDPVLESRLDDSIAFRRFCGFPLDQHVPDHVTLHRFRQKLADKNLLTPILAEIDRQFVKAGWVVAQGTLIDATMVRSAAAAPPREEDGTSGTSPKDPEARWRGSRTGRGSFGYMANVGVDKDSCLIRKVVIKPGNENESLTFDECLSGDEKEVYADSAYSSKERHEKLEKEGKYDGVMKRNRRKQPLTEQELERNMTISPIRKTVEKVFGVMKRSYGLFRLSVFGEQRVKSQIFLTAIAYNITRAVNLRST